MSEVVHTKLGSDAIAEESVEDREIGLSGHARLDRRPSPDGTVHLSEADATRGAAADEDFALLVNQAGIDSPQRLQGISSPPLSWRPPWKID